MCQRVAQTDAFLYSGGMNRSIVLDKKRGQTPLECLEAYRASLPELANIPMTYAGRLDPLATGLLLVLAGEERFKKEYYLGLDKEYEVEVLLGVSTDTGDVLGLIKKYSKNNKKICAHPIDYGAFKKLTGKRVQKYPAYSSKPYEGEPLFAHARAGTSPEELPAHEIKINSISITGMRSENDETVKKEIFGMIGVVRGDFRQQEILARWEKFFTKNHIELFPILTMRVNCGSGAYMRILAEEIGEALGTPALAYRIHRTKIGPYKL